MQDPTHHNHPEKSRCRICKEHVDHNNAFYPFCSARCKQVDLGRWATGTYVVSRPATDDEVQEAVFGGKP